MLASPNVLLQQFYPAATLQLVTQGGARVQTRDASDMGFAQKDGERLVEKGLRQQAASETTSAPHRSDGVDLDGKLLCQAAVRYPSYQLQLSLQAAYSGDDWNSNRYAMQTMHGRGAMNRNECRGGGILPSHPTPLAVSCRTLRHARIIEGL